MPKKRIITMGFDNKPVTIEEIMAHIVKNLGRKKNQQTGEKIVPQPSGRA